MQKGERWGEVRLDVAGWTPHPKPGWLARMLGQIPLFGGLSKDDLRVVADLVQLRHYVTGVSVVRAGARGDSLHVILEGRAAVRPEVGDDRDLAAGDFFGELALLDGAPRAATVVATEGLSTARLPAPGFRKLLNEEPAIAVGLLPGLVHVVRDLQTPLPTSGSAAALEPLDGGSLGDPRDLLAWQMALRHAPLLSSLPDRHLRRVVQRFRVRRGAAGSQLVRMGARGTSFFVVLDGSVLVEPADGPGKPLEAGACFGELALIDGASRAATVTALDDVTVAELPRPDFERLLRNEPRTALYLVGSLMTLIRTLQGTPDAQPLPV